MKKKLSLMGLIALLVIVPVLAYTYSASITVTEDGGNSYTDLPIILLMDNQELADSGFIHSTGLDVQVLSGNDTLPHMVVDDRTLFAVNLTANTQQSFLYTIGNPLLSSFWVLVGQGGYLTVPDSEYIELDQGWSVEISGLLNTANGTDKYLFHKGNAYRLWYTDDQEITSHIEYTTWTSPTGSEDPSSNWTSESNAYDDNTGTSANCVDIPAGDWTGYLNLTHAVFDTWRARYNISVTDNTSIDQLDLDYYDSYTSTWYNIYTGSFTKDGWEEQGYPQDIQDSVTKLRLRFHNNGGSSENVSVNEVDFGQTYFVRAVSVTSDNHSVRVDSASANMTIYVDDVSKGSIVWSDNVSVPNTDEDWEIMKNNSVVAAEYIRISRLTPVGEIIEALDSEIPGTDGRAIHVTGNIYLIIDANQFVNVKARTRSIGPDGEIGSVIDSLTLDTDVDNGNPGSPAHVYGDVYAAVYGGSGPKRTRVSTFTVDSGGQIGSVIDSIDIDNRNDHYIPDMIQSNLNSNIFLVINPKSGGGSLFSITINNDGSIDDSVIDSASAGDVGQMYHLINAIGNNTAVIADVDAGTIRGKVFEYSVDSSGNIDYLFESYFDNIQFSGGMIHHLANDIYAIIYWGNSGGEIATVAMDFDGTDPTYIDTWIAHSGYVDRFRSVKIGLASGGSATVFTAFKGSSGGSDDSKLLSFAINHDGTIVKTLIDEEIVQENEADGSWDLFHIEESDNIYGVLLHDYDVSGVDEIYTYRISNVSTNTTGCYQPNTIVVGTILPDRTIYNNDATITWGNNPTGVTVALGSLTPVSQAVAVTETVSDVPDFVPTTEDVPQVTVTGVEGETFPFYAMFKELLGQWAALGGPNISMPYFWKVVAVVIAWIMGTAAMISTRNVFIGIVAYLVFFAIPAGAMGGVLDMWVPIIYGIGAICVALLTAKWGQSSL